MKQFLLMVTFVLAGFCTAAFGAAPFVPEAPNITAKGFILVDYDSGKVLAELKPDERLDPASLTKIMTSYVVFKTLDAGRIAMTDQVLVSEKAWRMSGSRMFIEVNSKVSVEDLIKGMVIQSGNDASVALAEHVAGSEGSFADLMNEQAKRLGMTASHFMNATGLPDPQHYTSARDMATLATALIRDFPSHYHWHAQKEFVYHGITQHNRNRLLWRDESVDGVKTGHTEAAGYCLVASAKRDGMRLVAVVMGTASENARAKATQELLNWGYRFYETRRIYAAAEPIQTRRIWKGEVQELPLGLARDLYITVPRGQGDKLNAAVSVDQELIAPVQKGERFGTVRVAVGDNQIVEEPLVAMQDVPEGSLWRRMLDGILLMFN